MKLPDATNAIIEQAKVVEYLLNSAHPDNGGKAAFFKGLGFTSDDWSLFARALRQVALDNSCIRNIASPFGVKFVVDGVLSGPGQRQAKVRTIWIAEPHLPSARLVTAYPVARMETR